MKRHGRPASTWGYLWVFGVIGMAVAARAGVPDFCFIQISDMHLSPWPVDGPDPFERDRSTGAIRWVVEQAGQLQRFETLDLTAGRPAFLVATGDLSEYGFIGNTWKNLERSFEGLAMPRYLLAGNHDNTWTSMLHLLQDIHGGDEYTFEKFGCQFIMLNTATPQEPVPTIEARTLTWLSRVLAKVPPDRPLFVFCHHPLSSNEFAQPHETLRLAEVLQDRPVAVLLMGHGHSPRFEQVHGIDSVMGGSTFGPNTGYNVISVKDGRLRVVYRFREEDKAPKLLLDKPLPTQAPADLDLQVEMAGPSMPAGETSPALHVSVDAKRGPLTQAEALLNGSDDHLVTLQADEGGRLAGRLSVEGLLPGRHYVLVRGRADGSAGLRLREFINPANDALQILPGERLPAGSKSGPLRFHNGWLLATTAGELRFLPDDSQGGSSRVLFRAGGAILNAPLLADHTAYFGASDGKLYAVDLPQAGKGKLRWSIPLPSPAYGTPAINEQTLFVGDLEGNVHAVTRATGKIAWSVKHAAFSIEQSLTLDRGRLYFGAWDGFVYAISAEDGKQIWKAQGPAGQTDPKKKSRYYGPADASPMRLGDRLYVVDRAYVLGAYALSDGAYLGLVSEQVAAISAGPDGAGFYARGLADGVTRFNTEGEVIWQSKIPAGRFPAPPVEDQDRIYCCSNRGVVSIMEAATGRILAQVQATADLPVMAPVGVREGRACVVGMDGSVMRLSLP